VRSTTEGYEHDNRHQQRSPAGPDELPDDLPVLLVQLARDEWVAQVILHDLPWDWSATRTPERH